MNNGAGFDEVFTPWSLPDGGFIVAGENSGFTALEGVPGSGFDAGSEVWKAIDLDGSGTADLVVTSALDGGSSQHLVFGTSGAHFWKVYWNPYWVGVPEQQASSSGLHVSPNPATGPVDLMLEHGIVREAVLHDVHGHEVLRERSAHMDVGALDAGLYVITVVDGDGVQHRVRLVKQ